MTFHLRMVISVPTNINLWKYLWNGGNISGSYDKSRILHFVGKHIRFIRPTIFLIYIFFQSHSFTKSYILQTFSCKYSVSDTIFYSEYIWYFCIRISFKSFLKFNQYLLRFLMSYHIITENRKILRFVCSHNMPDYLQIRISKCHNQYNVKWHDNLMIFRSRNHDKRSCYFAISISSKVLKCEKYMPHSNRD